MREAAMRGMTKLCVRDIVWKKEDTPEAARSDGGGGSHKLPLLHPGVRAAGSAATAGYTGQAKFHLDWKLLQQKLGEVEGGAIQCGTVK